MIDYLKMIALSFYMLIIMWWKFILVLSFLVIRRRYLVHKLRFTLLGLLICYTIDLVVPELFIWSMNWFSDPPMAANRAQIWMITTTATKILIGAVSLYLLCKYYESERETSKIWLQVSSKNAERRHVYKKETLKYAYTAAAIGFILVAVIEIASILRSSSSTAAIGFLFVPMVSLIGAIPFFMFGYSFKYAHNWYRSQERNIDFTVIIALATSAILFLVGAKFLLEGVYLTNLVRGIKTMNEAALNKTIDKPFLGKNKFVLGAIAQNKNASGALLRTIGYIEDKDLHKKMWSVFPIMGENTRGLAVMRLVARHPNVLPETLEYLSKSQDDYVLGDVAANEKTSVATLTNLSLKRNYLIEWGLARNPSTPSDILDRLSKSDNEYTRADVARNPATPLSALEKLAKDQQWNVRRSVTENPQKKVELLEQLCKDSNENVRRSAEIYIKK